MLIPPAMESVVISCGNSGDEEKKPTNKRNRSEGGGEATMDEAEMSSIEVSCCGDSESGAKKARSDSEEINNSGSHSDSDSYDDLEDDFETPDNMDDFLDEDEDDVMDEDDRYDVRKMDFLPNLITNSDLHTRSTRT